MHPSVPLLDAQPTCQPDEQTQALITALAAVSVHIPQVIHALRQRTLPAAKQHEFGELLSDLGALLQEHKDAETSAGGRLPPP